MYDFVPNKGFATNLSLTNNVVKNHKFCINAVNISYLRDFLIRYGISIPVCYTRFVYFVPSFDKSIYVFHI